MAENNLNFKTLPELVNYVLNTYRNSSALNYKKLGHWEHISTEEFVETVRRLTLGLKAIGVEPGTKCGIIIPPSPIWVMIDLAIIMNGAVSVPMFPNISLNNFNFEVNDSSMKFLFIKNHNILEEGIQNRLRDFKKIITLDVGEECDNMINYIELLSRGDEVSSVSPELYKTLFSSVKEEDLATIIYTSGSTGVPKGVSLTHKNIISQIRGAAQRFPIDPSKDRILSCLPLAHVFERMVIYYYISTGTSIYFADDIKKVGDLLRELHPSVFTIVPRLLEKVYAKMHKNVNELSGLRKGIAKLAFHSANTKPPEKKTLMTKLFDHLVYKKLKEALGGKLRYAICGSAYLDTNIERFFINIGLPLYQGYGLTECSPVVSANYPGNNKPGTVGKAFPEVTVKLAEDNEILVRGPGVFNGYYKNIKDTKLVIDEDGWFHTGDLGSLDSENYLTITGRKKELFKTSTGKYVSPIPIEQSVKECEIIDTAAVIAEGRKFVSLLLFPDFENLESIKEARGKKEMSDDEFLSSQQVMKEISLLIDNINKKLNSWEKINQYRLIKEPVTVETEELTPTMKLRRHVIEKKYKKIIDEFYEE
jgi:long-chain acyl-CoA synthetase